MALNVARRARVHNIFGDVKDSSSLYFVLRRQRLTDGTYGAFQYIPYASVTDGYVPDHELYYRDRSGKRQKGLGIYLGKVQLLEKAGNDFTKTAIDIAVGKKVSRNPDEHKRATINLGLLQIGLHE
jgi:hypothetical protein